MKRISIIAVLLSLLFVACKKDDDSSNNNGSCSNATMSATLDGQQWTATSFNNTMIKGVDAGVETKRLDIRGTASDGTTIIISVANFKEGMAGDCIEIKTFYGNTDLSYCEQIDTWDVCEGILGTYMLNQAEFYMTHYDGGTVEITACNETDKSISGNFEFMVARLIDNDSIQINGSFANQCYSIYQ